MAWNSAEPVASSLVTSAPVRANFQALQAAVGGINLIADPTFLIWAAGDSAVPSHWGLAGTGSPTIARCGTGLGDTSRKVGKYCAKATSGSSNAVLYQDILTTASYDDFLDGLTISAGAWIKSNSTGSKLLLHDGATSSFSAAHTGDNTWQWLTCTHTISGSATRLYAALNMAYASITGYLSGLTVILGDVPPVAFRPARPVPGAIKWSMRGNLATATEYDVFPFSRPFLALDTQLYCKTAPASQAIIVDVNHWDGSAWQSMYSTRPQIAAAAKAGNAAPDGTYRYRCFKGIWGSTITDGLIGFDVDQVGSGTVGADMTVAVRGIQFARPFEGFIAYNE